jgi:hypothetical protein
MNHRELLMNESVLTFCFLCVALGFAILRLRFTAHMSSRGIKVLSCNTEVDVATERKEVDGKRETLHNLTSLLLTNKTICRQAASAVPNKVL